MTSRRQFIVSALGAITLACNHSAHERSLYAVYDAVIAKWQSEHTASGRPRNRVIVVHEETTMAYNIERISHEVIQDALPGLAESTIQAFEAANVRPVQLTSKRFQDPRVSTINDEAIDTFFHRDQDLDDGWRQFYEEFPGAQGIARFSRVGFSDDRDQALVYFAIQSASTAGFGLLVLCEQSNGDWKVVGTREMYIS